MKTIYVPEREFINEETMEYIYIKPQTIVLEHSLVSISKWEQKYHKPFLSDKPKTKDEELYYVKCMTLTQNVDELVYSSLPDNVLNEINEYILDPMTATTISNSVEKKGSREIITSELIYYWMIQCNIPVEFQKWHLNRLLTLIRVCSIKNSPKKKMSKRELLERNRQINESRLKANNSRG